MNVLVVGSGAREHALAWKLAQSPRVDRVFAAPGNGGTAQVGQNLEVRSNDFSALARAANDNRTDLVVVGPEGPLAEGIVDYFEAQGIPVFGPSKAAATLEASKGFAKRLMLRHRIPCAASETFTDFEAAKSYVREMHQPPVIKADGLAAGKGVTVSQSTEEALQALEDAMVRGIFGEAGTQVVVEERLEGKEASVFAFTDGETVLSTVPACDYKRALDDDQGPNTGGMGSYSPPEFLDDEALAQIADTILTPTVQAMAREGRPYRGALYAGLMMTSAGPKVLEYNCRLGDPETQVILPRMKTDLLEVIEAVISGRLGSQALDWDPRPCVGVVMASGGYPGSYQTGHPIEGLVEAVEGVTVFHAGTDQRNGVAHTAGGRVLTVSAMGADISEARAKAYAGLERLSFKDAQYRRDIGLRAVTAASA